VNRGLLLYQPKGPPLPGHAALILTRPPYFNSLGGADFESITTNKIPPVEKLGPSERTHEHLLLAKPAGTPVKDKREVANPELQPIPSGVTFLKALSKLILKARTSLLPHFSAKTRSSFEL